MKLDFTPLISGETTSLPVSFDLSLKDFQEDILDGIAHIEGTAQNHAGYMELTGEMKLDMKVKCSRCATETEKKMKVPFTFPVCESLDGENVDDYVILENCALDLDTLFRDNIMLELPSKFLCKKDCKGLCHRCGANLNTEKCSCAPEIDPRMAKLLDLLDDKK